MESTDRTALVRVTISLFLAQALASAAFGTSTTINQLAIVDLSGSKVLAGLPGAFVLGGSALAAYPAGRIMARIGRRDGLIIGACLGGLGALLAGLGLFWRNMPVFLAGLFFLGAGRGALDQSRYAAAEISPPNRRASRMSIVVWGGTIGAALGPALSAPMNDIGKALGLHDYTGPMFTTGILYGVTAILLAVLLALDLRGIAQRVAAAYPSKSPSGNSETDQTSNRSFGQALRLPDVRAALAAMACAQAAMVLVMGTISLHMQDHQHTPHETAFVLSLHVVGMFAFSPIMGMFSDRFGRKTMIGIGALVIAAGCIVSNFSVEMPPISAGLFLVGLGWSACYVAGSALLTDALGVNERARLQGASDAIVNVASAIGSLSSGILLAALGFGPLSMVGLAVALVPLLVMAQARTIGQPQTTHPVS